MKTGRNDPCPCGSGAKFKKCCLLKETGSPAPEPMAVGEERLLLRGSERSVLLIPGQTYRVSPTNPKKLKHRDRTCTLLAVVPEEQKAEVLFADTKRKGKVDAADLVLSA